MIDYTFEVVSTDTANKVMEVKYTAAGLNTLSASMPLPLVGQDITEVVAAYAPIALWEQETSTVQSVIVGHSGALSYDKNPAPAPVETLGPNVVDDATAKMWAQVAFEKKLAAALIKFGLLTTDPTEIPATTL